jgi:hypothetical protein
MVSQLLIYVLTFTLFSTTSISVGFPFVSNIKMTRLWKLVRCEKHYILVCWHLFYGFAYFKHTLNCLKRLTFKFKMICTNVPPSALDNQPEPCLWLFPFDFRQQLQTSCNTTTTIVLGVKNSFGSDTMPPAQLSFTGHTFLNINL